MLVSVYDTALNEKRYNIHKHAEQRNEKGFAEGEENYPIKIFWFMSFHCINEIVSILFYALTFLFIYEYLFFLQFMINKKLHLKFFKKNFKTLFYQA